MRRTVARRLPALGSLVAVLVALLGVTAASAATDETVSLPPPTGPHAVGRASLHWVDASREELETADPDDARELMVHLFYPAAVSDVMRATYVPDAADMRGPWRADQIERITAMPVVARESAPPLAGRHPIAVFQPGGGMKVLTYHALLEDLASHGWVVAAIDPPYNARAVRFPDGRVLRTLPDSERGWPTPGDADQELRFYRERNVHWARDVRFVIDELEALDAGDGPFAARLAVELGVGVVGHSRGGQSAGTVRLIEPRVRGGLNLDGAISEEPIQPADLDPDAPETSGEQPFLWIQTPFPSPTDEELEADGHTRAEFDAFIGGIVDGWHARLATVPDGAMRVVFEHPGITHIDFSDEPFWGGFTSPDDRPGKERTIEATRLWVRAFLEGAVLEDWSALDDLVAAAEEPGSDVVVHELAPMGGADDSEG